MTQHVITVQLKIGILDGKNGQSHCTLGQLGHTVHCMEQRQKTNSLNFQNFTQCLSIIWGWLVKKSSSTHTHTSTKIERGNEEEEEEKRERQTSRLSPTDLVLWFNLIGIYLLCCQKHLSGQWTECTQYTDIMYMHKCTHTPTVHTTHAWQRARSNVSIPCMHTHALPNNQNYMEMWR